MGGRKFMGLNSKGLGRARLLVSADDGAATRAASAVVGGGPGPGPGPGPVHSPTGGVRT